MGAFPYIVGRRRRDLATLLRQAEQSKLGVDEQDKIFAAIRLDEHNLVQVTDAKFNHCTFLNVGFRGVSLKDCNLADCVFIACYFRRATWRDCRFQACRFIDCQFTGLQISDSRFFYSRFSDCYLPYNRIEQCLPTQANLRRDLAHNLATEASKLGLPDEARKFRWCEIQATEDHLRRAVRQQEPYYKDHYPRLRDQIGAGLRLVGSRLNRALWGYGERGRVLVRNFMIIMLILFPLTFYVLERLGDLHSEAGAKDVAFGDIISFSVQHILEPTISSGLVPSGVALWITAFEGFLGLMLAGLLVSYLFQWIVRR